MLWFWKSRGEPAWEPTYKYQSLPSMHTLAMGSLSLQGEKLFSYSDNL